VTQEGIETIKNVDTVSHSTRKCDMGETSRVLRIFLTTNSKKMGRDCNFEWKTEEKERELRFSLGLVRPVVFNLSWFAAPFGPLKKLAAPYVVMLCSKILC
jgi:hypothetical protein